MQKEISILKEIFSLKFFPKKGRSFKASILMLFSFGLFSNAAFAQFPVLENFNTGIPASWGITSNQTVANNWVPTAPTAGYLNTPGVMVNPALNTTVGTTAEYFLVSPQFITPQVTEVRFHTKQGSFINKGTTFEVRLSTANQPDYNSFNVLLASWTEATLNVSATTWEEKIVTLPELPAGVNVHIAFIARTNQVAGNANTVGDIWYIDNTRVIESCAKVASINSTMSATGGLFNWTHPTATNFEIQIVGDNAGIAASGTPVTGTSFNATTLTNGNPFVNGTNYDVYIKTICDGTTASLWAGPFNVQTSVLGLTCATPVIIPTNISTSPYVLSTNLNTFYDNQTYTPLTSIGLSCQPISSDQNWLNGEHAFLSYTPTTSGLVNLSLLTSNNPSLNCYNNLASVFIFDSCNVGTTANCLGSLITGQPSGVNSVQLQNIYLQGGQTYYFVISSPFEHSDTPEGSAGLCFTFTLSQPTCSIPSGITYDNLLQTNARFSWANPQNLVSAWEYIAKPASAGVPVGGDVLTPTSTNINNIASSLTPNTKYNLYVRSVCSGTPGAWSTPFPFTTQCTVFPTPYSTQFTGASSTDPEPCWSKLDLNNDGISFTYSADGSSNPTQGEYARLRTLDSGNQTNDMLTSAQIHLDGVTQKRLRFKFKGFGGYTNNSGYVLGESSFMIKLSTTGVGPANFTTVVEPIQTYQTGNNWIEKIVPLPNIVGDINLAWHFPPSYVNTATNFLLDDVYVEEMPSCSEPSYPVVTPGSITTNSVNISWTNGYQNTQWQLVAQPLGTGVPTLPFVSDAVVNIVSTNPYTITGLNPSTQYEFYMRAYCSTTDQSIWVGPINFNTLCIAQPTPYYESLNDTDVTTKKFCWSVNNNNGDENSEWEINATQATIQPRDLFFTPFVSFDDYLITAQVNVTGQKMLKFKYKVASNIFTPVQRGNFQVLMSSTPDFQNPTVLIPSHDFYNGDFEEDFVIFNGIGPAYFAFHVPPTMTDPGNSGIVTIDDFSIEEAPLCPNPSLLAATNILTTSATLNWAPGFNETQWEMVLQSPNSGVPTGSGTVINTNPTYNATNLAQNAYYEYYVRAVCGSNYSAWIGPFKFKTACTIVSTPFIETFETNSQTESCWAIINSNGDSNIWDLNMPVEPMFGEQMAALNCFTNGNSNDWLISPTITAQPNQRLRFFHKGKYDPAYFADLKVKISTNGGDISQFTTTLYNTDVTGSLHNVEQMEMIINLTGITVPTNINIAFQVPPGEPDAAGNGLRGSYLNIDNVIIENIPACPAVYNVATNNNAINDTNAEINWQVAGSETQWEVSVQPFGTPAPVGNTLPQYLQIANSYPYTITGLTPSTSYQYYVRAVCSSTSQSEWVGPFDLLTKCDLANVCEYTISLTNGTTGHVYDAIDIVQNGVVQQSLIFPYELPNQPPTVVDFQVFLCSGIEFNLHWRGGGSGLQYSQAQAVVKNQAGVIVWTSPLGLGAINTNIYTGVANCTPITCPQPTNLAVSNMGVLSWTPGGSETQWEVFVQPLGQGSIPTSGILVNTPSYTPVAADFLNATAGTNEFLVRAICSNTNKSYWTGPKVFIKNDEPATAIALQVNNDGTCSSKGTKASFIGATASSVPTSCSGINGGDIWYEFVATSKVHTVEISNFNPGTYYASSYGGGFPSIVLSLYEVQPNSSLVEKACSENNSLVARYTSELIVGKTYKIRVKYIATEFVDKKFDICVSTPADICDMDAFNYSFEKLPMQNLTGVSTIIHSKIIPGWRTNTDWGTMFFHEASNSPGVIPYEGAQCIQLTQDGAAAWDPTDPNIKGLYKDFETSSEILKVDYSFASASRLSGAGTTVELWAGPPSGPFTKLTEHTSSTLVWNLITGTYTVPTGQTTTRFIFRTQGNAIGHMLDAANFKVNTDIVTADATLDCSQSSINVEANGVGEWVASATNPSVATIANPTNPITTISGINTAGVYTFLWKTRYCEKALNVTLSGFTEVPTVTSPVTYCTSETATALTATAPAGYTLLWFTVPVNGVGDVNAPTPSTATAGTTTYYVALVNATGCVGPRVAIDVIVNQLITPVVLFSYDNTSYCENGANPVLVPATGFTSGGTYSATPSGLSIDANTGAINLQSSSVGSYVITYNLLSNGCTLSGTSTTNIEVINEVTFNLESVCENQMMLLNVIPTNGSDLSSVDYTWQNSNGTTIGTNSPQFNVTEYLASNSSLTFPMTFTVLVDSEGCVNSDEITLDGNSCGMIPKGISPNGDGDNDTFDLTGLGVKELSIINRYGMEVFSFSGKYTNQFAGSTNDGKNLPDGTYFYSISFDNGKAITGWVYVIRQY